jgi:hypothetical protein
MPRCVHFDYINLIIFQIYIIRYGSLYNSVQHFRFTYLKSISILVYLKVLITVLPVVLRVLLIYKHIKRVVGSRPFFCVLKQN